MSLAPNTGYGLLNPGTTAPKVAAPNPLDTTPTTTTTTTAATPPPLDYTQLLKNDPILGQTLAGLNASGVSNQAALNAAQQRALIQYGSVPTTALPGVTGIDQTTRDLANQNTSAGLSTLAKIQNAYKQADQASVASEAARGILRSGAYGQHAAENLLGYNQAQDTGTQTLLDYLSGLYNGYLQQQQQLQQSAYGAQSDALSRILAQIQAGLITGTGAGPTSHKGTNSAPPPDGSPAANSPSSPAALYSLLNPYRPKAPAPAPAYVPRAVPA